MPTVEPVLNEAAKKLFEPFAYGTLSTTNPDGGPQVSLVTAWLDGDEIVLFHRGWYQKLRNIGRMPKVALAIVPTIREMGSPNRLPPYLVIHGIARIQEGDATQWSDKLLDIVRAAAPAGTDIITPTMPQNGGWTTHIHPTRLVGFGPWMT